MLKTLAIGLATLLAVGCGSSPEPSAGLFLRICRAFSSQIGSLREAVPFQEMKASRYLRGRICQWYFKPCIGTPNAENRARAEIQKTFETYSASLMKDYMSSTTEAICLRATSSSLLKVTKTFSAGTLSGVVITDASTTLMVLFTLWQS